MSNICPSSADILCEYNNDELPGEGKRVGKGRQGKERTGGFSQAASACHLECDDTHPTVQPDLFSSGPGGLDSLCQSVPLHHNTHKKSLCSTHRRYDQVVDPVLDVLPDEVVDVAPFWQTVTEPDQRVEELHEVGIGRLGVLGRTGLGERCDGSPATGVADHDHWAGQLARRRCEGGKTDRACILRHRERTPALRWQKGHLVGTARQLL